MLPASVGVERPEAVEVHMNTMGELQDSAMNAQIERLRFEDLVTFIRLSK